MVGEEEEEDFLEVIEEEEEDFLEVIEEGLGVVREEVKGGGNEDID